MLTDTPIPSSTGTYVIALGLPAGREISVGALGSVSFESGIYLYVGSARGPGGLAARLGHHLRSAPRAHWHLDYLRRIARPSLIWFAEGSDRRECLWAERLARIGLLSSGPPNFGASDCRCQTHLFRTQGERPAVVAAVDEALRPACRRSVETPEGL